VILDVVVVTYESARHLPQCLAGLPAGADVVVVDNASRDDSADLAQYLGARVVRNPANLGFATAANQGARLGRHDLILFLNPDAAFDPASLERLAAAVEVDEGVFAAGPRLRRPGGGEQQAWWPFPSASATWIEALGLHRLRPAAPGPDGSVPFVVGACLLMRRRHFEGLGGFDERFWLYGEEADLCYRAAQRGWTVRYVPEVAAEHVGGASGHAIGSLAFEHFQRGTEHFILKHHGRLALLAHRLGLLTGSLLRLPLLYAGRRSAGTARIAVRRAAAARLAGVLFRHPTRVAP
jgi:N-acetylglucosaminyl-diphospho-decaprenol L-rhamnosyltransferase